MSGEANFWSRRRAGVEAEELAERAALEAETLATEKAALEEKSDEELLEELELPDPDKMEMGDDFSAFMSKAVPDRLRRRALRKLWLSNPVLANVDELVDYGEDFTDSAMVVENMQTAYQVGKGMLKHVQEMARQATEKEAAENAPDEEELEETNEVIALAEDAEDAVDDITEDEPEFVAAEEEIEPEALIAAAPRRMQFRIETETA